LLNQLVTASSSPFITTLGVHYFRGFLTVVCGGPRVVVHKGWGKGYRELNEIIHWHRMELTLTGCVNYLGPRAMLRKV